MTRKDYVTLAAAFANTRPHPADYAGGIWGIWRDTVSAVADVLAADNPRFDRERFTEACYA